MKLLKYAWFILALSIVSFDANAQFKSKEEIELGNRLKALYPDDDVCALTSSERYTFAIGKNDTVGAMKFVEEELVGMKDRAGVSIVESYDTFSEIEFIRTFNKEGKKYVPGYQSVVDKPYFQSDIFDDDNRYKSFSFYYATLEIGRAHV
mgnify:CR=1 FL=1